MTVNHLKWLATKLLKLDLGNKFVLYAHCGLSSLASFWILQVLMLALLEMENFL